MKKQENNKHKLKMETIGNLIDKLTVTNIRIWMAEDVKRNNKLVYRKL